MERSYRAPFYPFFPGFALLAAIVCMIAMIYYNPLVAMIFAGFLAVGYVYFLMTAHQRAIAPRDDQIEATN